MTQLPTQEEVCQQMLLFLLDQGVPLHLPLGPCLFYKGMHLVTLSKTIPMI